MRVGSVLILKGYNLQFFFSEQNNKNCKAIILVPFCHSCNFFTFQSCLSPQVRVLISQILKILFRNATKLGLKGKRMNRKCSCYQVWREKSLNKCLEGLTLCLGFYKNSTAPRGHCHLVCICICL